MLPFTVKHLARITNVQFDNLRIEQSPGLISLWIGKAFWTRDDERGHIDGVRFEEIQARADPLRIELKGFDATHAVENVLFQNVVVNGKPLTAPQVNANEFVNQLALRP